MQPSSELFSRDGERGLFGEAAARLCNAAAVILGWKPDEFWNATPAELALALQIPGSAAGPDDMDL